MNYTGQLMDSQMLLQVLSLSGNATAIYQFDELIIQTANDAMIALWGKDRSVIGQPLEDAVPELKGQPFAGLLKEVWRTGNTYRAKDMPAELNVDGKLQLFYFDFEYRAIADAQGKTYCILHTATEVTGRMAALKLVQKKEEKEQQLNEELAASNEELTAINEEYQATNEELSALNEEYQAINEQLTELNDQLNLTNEELRKTHERLSALHNELVITEQKTRVLLEKAPIAIGVIDAQTYCIRSANDKLVKLWGMERLTAETALTDALGQKKAGLLIEIIKQVKLSRQPVYENDVRTLVGPEKLIAFYNYIYHPVTGSNGQIMNIMLVASEITEQRLARLELQQMEEKMRLAVEAAKLGTWHIHPQTKALKYNNMLAEIFGYEGESEMTYEEAIGQVTAEHRERIQQEIERAIRTGEDYDITYSQRRFNDNELIWLRSLGKIAQDAAGEYTIFSGLVMDVTELKKDEQRKNDFIGMVSHELKTPLTSLSAYIQMLQLKAVKSQDNFSSGALGKANNLVKKMNAMINGFLNLSRLEAGKIQLEKQTFALDALIKETVEEAQLLSPNHTVSFTPSDPIIIKADKNKIGNVISNLLSNAVKYSGKDSSVEISCSLKDHQAVFAVKDYGIGIKSEDLPKLFDRYYRVESNQHTIAGFGIGLYLSAEIVERHDGKIWATSEIGNGSTFYVSLPVIN